MKVVQDFITSPSMPHVPNRPLLPNGSPKPWQVQGWGAPKQSKVVFAVVLAGTPSIVWLVGHSKLLKESEDAAAKITQTLSAPDSTGRGPQAAVRRPQCRAGAALPLLCRFFHR